ncbi:MAG: hypothetical protein ACQEVA_02700 [Myxococcota bacterium]
MEPSNYHNVLMRANDPPRQFSSWSPLTADAIGEAAPDGPAAIQVRVGGKLLDYPDGYSSMVCYLYATESARAALLDVFADELEDPGSLGLGDLEFRTFDGTGAREWMTRLMFKFESTFGTLPRMNQQRTEASDSDREE